MVTGTVNPNVMESGLGNLVLRIRGAAYQNQIIRLKSTKCTIGAGPNCTLRLHGKDVDQVHCLILRGPNGTVIQRWSPNTRLNGQTFTSAPLSPGDRLGIGATEFDVIATAEQTVPLSETTGSPVNQEPPLPPQAQPSEKRKDFSERPQNHARQLRLKEHALALRARQLDQTAAALQAEKEQFNLERCQWEAIRGDLLSAASQSQTAALDKRLTELDAQQAELAAKSSELQSRYAELETLEKRLYARDEELKIQSTELDDRAANLHAQTEALQQQTSELNNRIAEFAAKSAETESRWAELEALEKRLHAREEELQIQSTELDDRTAKLNTQTEDLQQQTNELNNRIAEFASKSAETEDRHTMLDTFESQLKAREVELQTLVAKLDDRSAQLNAQTEDLQRQIKELNSRTAELTDKSTETEARRADLDVLDIRLKTREEELQTLSAKLDARSTQLVAQATELKTQAAAREKQIAEQKTQTAELQSRYSELERKESEFEKRHQDWDEFCRRQENALREKEEELNEKTLQLKTVQSGIQYQQEQSARQHDQQAVFAAPKIDEGVVAEPPAVTSRSFETPTVESDTALPRDKSPTEPATLVQCVGHGIDSQENEEQISVETTAQALEPLLEKQQETLTQTPPEQSSDHAEEESVEEYMVRLMERIRSTQGEVSGTTDKPYVSYTSSLEPTPQPPETASTPAEKILPPLPKSRELLELLPRTQAPEKKVDISMLRTLANYSAQAALGTHARRQMINIMYSKLAVTLTGGFVGLGLLWVWHSYYPNDLTYYAAMMGFVVAVVWGIRYLFITFRLMEKSSVHVQAEQVAHTMDHMEETPTDEQSDDQLIGNDSSESSESSSKLSQTSLVKKKDEAKEKYRYLKNPELP